MQMKIFNFLSKIDTGKNIDLVFLLVILTAFPYLSITISQPKNFLAINNWNSFSKKSELH